MRYGRVGVLFAVAAGMAALFFTASYASAHQLPEDFKGFEDPAKCGMCHKAIFEEWKDSVHANSSKFKDPLHSALHNAFSSAMEEKGKKGNYHCANCHTPTADNIAALMKGEEAPDPANVSNTRGVTCSFCHMVDGIIEGKNFHSYKVANGIMGASAESKAPHGAAKWSFEKPYEMCLGCHGKKVNGKGGVICSMEEEGISDCLSCHMKKVDGAPAQGSDSASHAYHGIYGGHDMDVLASGAAVSIGAEGDELTVTVTNPNPHYFPSTNPLRMAYVVVVVSGKDGKPLFKNINTAPTDDPGALFVKMFRAGDQVGVPSWEAEGVAMDTRLKPGETRALTYRLPEGAASASATLVYRFAPPKALEKLGLSSESAVSEPRIVSSAKMEL